MREVTFRIPVLRVYCLCTVGRPFHSVRLITLRVECHWLTLYLIDIDREYFI